MSAQGTQSYEEYLVLGYMVTSRTERPSVSEPGTYQNYAHVGKVQNDNSSARQ